MIILFDRKMRDIMISTIDRKRILIFVAVAWGIAIVLAVVISLSGGLVGSSPYKAALLGSHLADSVHVCAGGRESLRHWCGAAFRVFATQYWENG